MSTNEPVVPNGQPVKAAPKDGIHKPADYDRPRRFCYADPPYPGQAYRYYGKHPQYGGEVDHEALIKQLVAEYPDGWALSTSSMALQMLLPWCPVGVRVGAWTKDWANSYPGQNPIYAWEPVIFYGGRPRVTETSVMMLDWVNKMPPQGREVIGAKPLEFNVWVFRFLNALQQDEMVDMFPGSGAVGRAWEAYTEHLRTGSKSISVEHPRAKQIRGVDVAGRGWH